MECEYLLSRFSAMFYNMHWGEISENFGDLTKINWGGKNDIKFSYLCESLIGKTNQCSIYNSLSY